uniref:Uncharacterized protein n=1 Tax=Oryza brachyantha TaxID=4533 RepID=J3LJ94_ORYBR
ALCWLDTSFGNHFYWPPSSYWAFVAGLKAWKMWAHLTQLVSTTQVWLHVTVFSLFAECIIKVVCIDELV